MSIGRTNVGRSPPGRAAVRDRRRPPGFSALRGLRWLRGLIRRPFRVLWRGGLPRLSWVERRHLSAPDLALQQLRADLRAELPAQDGKKALPWQDLLRVQEQLERAGWAGVAKLPLETLAGATAQAERLAASSASPALADLPRCLRALQPNRTSAAAPFPATVPGALDGLPASHPRAASADSIEVQELGEDAYVEAEQIWAASQPAPLPAPAAAPPQDGDLKA